MTTRKLFRIKKVKYLSVVLYSGLMLKEQIVFVYDCCVVMVLVVLVFNFCVDMSLYGNYAGLSGAG